MHSKSKQDHCAKRLPLDQTERYGKIDVINLMKIELNRCANVIDPVSIQSFGGYKNAMNAGKEQWSENVEVLLGKDLPLAPVNGFEKSFSTFFTFSYLFKKKVFGKRGNQL